MSSAGQRAGGRRGHPTAVPVAFAKGSPASSLMQPVHFSWPLLTPTTRAVCRAAVKDPAEPAPPPVVVLQPDGQYFCTARMDADWAAALAAAEAGEQGVKPGTDGPEQPAARGLRGRLAGWFSSGQAQQQDGPPPAPSASGGGGAGLAAAAGPASTQLAVLQPQQQEQTTESAGAASGVDQQSQAPAAPTTQEGAGSTALLLATSVVGVQPGSPEQERQLVQRQHLLTQLAVRAAGARTRRQIPMYDFCLHPDASGAEPGQQQQQQQQQQDAQLAADSGNAAEAVDVENPSATERAAAAAAAADNGATGTRLA